MILASPRSSSSNFVGTGLPTIKNQPPADATDKQLNASAYSSATTTNPSDLVRRLPPETTIEPITTDTLPGFRLLITSILPIRYPDQFYTVLLSNPDSRSISRIAKHSYGIIGGICCRVEPILPSPSAPLTTPAYLPPYQQSELYIQALAVKSAYQRLGIASALLDTVLEEAVGGRYGNVVSVYAHVWEVNEEAVGFYERKGFAVGEVQQGYYRKLRPTGARAVRRGLVGVAVGLEEREREIEKQKMGPEEGR